MQNPFGNLPLPTFQANTQRMHQGVGAEFPHGGAGCVRRASPSRMFDVLVVSSATSRRFARGEAVVDGAPHLRSSSPARIDTRASPPRVSDIPPGPLPSPRSPSMLVPGFAPAGASMPHAMDGLFPELMANAASQGRATPPGGAGAIFFNPLAHVSPAAESPPAAGAAKKTYISGYVPERWVPFPFPPPTANLHFFAV